MAARKPGKVAAPVKQKLRKRHGPKRHMFKDLKPMVYLYTQTGILSKYYNYESFALACASRGVKSGIPEMWMDYKLLPTNKDKDAYLANVKDNAVLALQKAEKRKAGKKSAQAK